MAEGTGQHIIAGAGRKQKQKPLRLWFFIFYLFNKIVFCLGELHLEICLKDLQEDFMNGAKLKISEPVVSFNETVN